MFVRFQTFGAASCNGRGARTVPLLSWGYHFVGGNILRGVSALPWKPRRPSDPFGLFVVLFSAAGRPSEPAAQETNGMCFFLYTLKHVLSRIMAIGSFHCVGHDGAIYTGGATAGRAGLPGSR